MIGCWLSVVGIWLLGTVFQTAVSLFHVIPRLRPGLLSLRSVLASSQIYQQATRQLNNETTIQQNNYTTRQQNNKTTRQQNN